MRIVAVMVVGAGEADRYLDRSLQEIRRLKLDDALIVANNVDPKTRRMLLSYGFQWYEDNRPWGVEQRYIKEQLAERVGLLKPDWVIAFDADEVFDSSLDRDGLERLAGLAQVSWYFYVVNLWNDSEHYQPGLCFWNIRFYKYRPEAGFKFEERHVHCGIAPRWAYHHGRYAPYLLIHRGLMDQANRERKIERYRQFDPEAIYKSRDYYDALASQNSGVPFLEGALHEEVAREVAQYRLKPVNEQSSMAHKYVLVRREDDKVIDIPEHHLRETLKRHPFWKVVDEVTKEKASPSAVEPPMVVPDPLECNLCGYVAPSAAGLKVHRGRKHK